MAIQHLHESLQTAQNVVNHSVLGKLIEDGQQEIANKQEQLQQERAKLETILAENEELHNVLAIDTDVFNYASGMATSLSALQSQLEETEKGDVIDPLSEAYIQQLARHLGHAVSKLARAHELVKTKLQLGNEEINFMDPNNETAELLDAVGSREKIYETEQRRQEKEAAAAKEAARKAAEEQRDQIANSQNGADLATNAANEEEFTAEDDAEVQREYAPVNSGVEQDTTSQTEENETAAQPENVDALAAKEAVDYSQVNLKENEPSKFAWPEGVPAWKVSRMIIEKVLPNVEGLRGVVDLQIEGIPTEKFYEKLVRDNNHEIFVRSLRLVHEWQEKNGHTEPDENGLVTLPPAGELRDLIFTKYIHKFYMQEMGWNEEDVQHIKGALVGKYIISNKAAYGSDLEESNGTLKVGANVDII